MLQSNGSDTLKSLLSCFDPWCQCVLTLKTVVCLCVCCVHTKTYTAACLSTFWDPVTGWYQRQCFVNSKGTETEIYNYAG